MESSTSFMVLKHVWAAPRQEVEKKRTGTGWILKFPGITVPLVSAGGSTVRLLRGQKVIEVTYEDATPTPSGQAGNCLHLVGYSRVGSKGNQTLDNG